MAQVILSEGAVPSIPSAGKVNIYAKADGLLYSMDDAGNETPLGGGGAGDMTKAVYDAANIAQQLVGLTATQTLTNKTLTSPVVNTPTGIVKGDVGLGNVDNTSNATERAATATLTNKTIIASSNVIEEKTTTASSATPTPTGGSLRNKLTITALAAAAELQAPSGTPQDGHMLVVRWLDNGTARALTYNAIYRGVVATLATTTVISKVLYQLFMYNSAATKWDLIAQVQEP